MLKRKQPVLLFFMALSTVALLGYGQLWSGDCNSLTPSVTTTVVEDNVKIVSGCDGKPIHVYFWEDGCTPSATDDCWRKAQAQKGVICTCTGAGCVDDFATSVDNDVVNCYVIKQAGAGAQGCVVYSNPRTYLFGGDAFRDLN